MRLNTKALLAVIAVLTTALTLFPEHGVAQSIKAPS